MADVEFAILGAGAIGTIIGAHLARAGHSVVMLARGQRAEQIRTNGLHVKGLIEFSTPVQTLTDGAQLRSADVLIVAMKTPGTREALQPLRNCDIGVAFSIQNGLWKDEQLIEAFDNARVLGALANTSGELLPSGEVLFTRNVNLQLGELQGGMSDRAQHIARAIDAAGVRATAVPDILSREWTKFVSWTALMAMSVTTRAATWRYLSDPDCALLMVRLVREMVSLASSTGVELSTEGSILPLPIIIQEADEQAVAAIVAIGRQFKANAPEHRMSTLQDLNAGRRLEIEETLGHALRTAQSRQLTLPLLETFYRLVAGIDRTSAS